MFAVAINFSDLNLSQEMEQYLEKEFTNLEKMTNQPREHHFKEALIRYMNNEWGIRDDTEKHIKKDFKGKNPPHDYHISEALFRYLEDIEDMKAIEKHEKDKKRGKIKYYTSEQVRKELGL